MFSESGSGLPPIVGCTDWATLSLMPSRRPIKKTSTRMSVANHFPRDNCHRARRVRELRRSYLPPGNVGTTRWITATGDQNHERSLGFDFLRHPEPRERTLVPRAVSSEDVSDSVWGEYPIDGSGRLDLRSHPEKTLSKKRIQKARYR